MLDTSFEVPQTRWRAAWVFLAVAVFAMLVAGIVAAASAHAPTRHIMWMVAYLVLVAGLIQAALGVGQALLATPLPSARFLAAECVLFNVGNIGVIAGTLLTRPTVVAAGTLVFVASLLAFLIGVRRARGGWPVQVFRGLLVITCIGAIVGLTLSFIRS